MKYNRGKLALALGLSLSLLTLSGLPSHAANGEGATSATSSAAQPAAVREKAEVIYAMLAADGGVKSMYAVNHFDVDRAGSVSDYGAYESVSNLTDGSAIALADGAVNFDAAEGDFYYQGNLGARALPWTVDVEYALDGAVLSAADLSGRSGELAIRIRTKQTPGSAAVFYDHYMLQISLTLDNQYCSRIAAPDATIAEAGGSRVLAFTVMPKKDGDFTVTAQVRDFSMPGIEIAAMPFSMNIETPDTAEMTDQFSELSDAIKTLNDGVGDLADGVSDVRSGAVKLRSGSSDIGKGLSTLSGNGKSIVEGSSQIQSALSQMATALSGGLSGSANEADMSAMGDLTALPQGLTRMAEGLRELSAGLSELKEGFSPAQKALDAAIEGIPEASLSQEQIGALYALAEPGQKATLDTLVESYKAAQTVKGTYAQVKAAFDAVVPALEQVNGGIAEIAENLEGISGQIGEALTGGGAGDAAAQMKQLAEGLSQLSSNYQSFHKGLAQYMGGVTKLSGGYSDFHSGLTKFVSGVGDLKEGVDELHDGTGELSDETAKLPDTLQEEIDKMLDEYTGSDFTPVSFVDARNENVGLVQFVIKCDGVEKPEAVKADTQEADVGVETGFMDRFVSLFRGNDEK